MNQTSASITSTETGFQLEGALTFNTVTHLVKQGKDLIEGKSSKTFVINLEQVNRIDSAGISLLIEWKRFSESNDSALSLVGMQKQAISLINTYRLNTLF